MNIGRKIVAGAIAASSMLGFSSATANIAGAEPANIVNHGGCVIIIKSTESPSIIGPGTFEVGPYTLKDGVALGKSSAFTGSMGCPIPMHT